MSLNYMQSRKQSCFCEINALLWITYDHLYYAPCLACWALFGSLVPAMCNRTSCAQVRELPQSRSGDNWEGTLFSWLHIYIYHSLWSYMLSLRKIILFTFHSLIFHSKNHKHPRTFLRRGGGNSSLKRTYVEGGRGYIHIKWTGMKKVRAADQKLEVSSEPTFWMTPKSLLQLRYMIC